MLGSYVHGHLHSQSERFDPVLMHTHQIRLIVLPKQATRSAKQAHERARSAFRKIQRATYNQVMMCEMHESGLGMPGTYLVLSQAL